MEGDGNKSPVWTLIYRGQSPFKKEGDNGLLTWKSKLFLLGLYDIVMWESFKKAVYIMLRMWFEITYHFVGPGSQRDNKEESSYLAGDVESTIAYSFCIEFERNMTNKRRC